MAKYFGKVGFGGDDESSPGVYMTQITEEEVYGDIYKDTVAVKDGKHANEEISLGMKISIFLNLNTSDYSKIKYATHLGTKWKVTSVEPQFPRLVLTMGGVYNAQ